MLRPVCAALCLLAAARAGAADCRLPPEPAIPDGAHASDDEMVRAHDAVATWVADGNAYVVCLTQLRDAADPNTPVEQVAEWTRQHNAAVDRMNDVADRFNAQLRLWKARESPAP